MRDGSNRPEPDNNKCGGGRHIAPPRTGDGRPAGVATTSEVVTSVVRLLRAMVLVAMLLGFSGFGPFRSTPGVTMLLALGGLSSDAMLDGRVEAVRPPED